MRTDSENRDFKELCSLLDNDLFSRYGEEQAKHIEHNIIEDSQPVIIGYVDELPVAIGCIKPFDKESVELKRVYVAQNQRRKGFSFLIVSALEKWAKELGFQNVFLETGKGQPEAINLYEKLGYQVIDSYGPYVSFGNSVCMRKEL